MDTRPPCSLRLRRVTTRPTLRTSLDSTNLSALAWPLRVTQHSPRRTVRHKPATWSSQMSILIRSPMRQTTASMLPTLHRPTRIPIHVEMLVTAIQPTLRSIKAQPKSAMHSTTIARVALTTALQHSASTQMLITMVTDPLRHLQLSLAPQQSRA